MRQYLELFVRNRTWKESNGEQSQHPRRHHGDASRSAHIPARITLLPSQLRIPVHLSRSRGNAQSDEREWQEASRVESQRTRDGFPAVPFFDEAGKVQGIAFDYLQLVLDQLGLSMRVEGDLSWHIACWKKPRRRESASSCAARSPGAGRNTCSFPNRSFLFPLVIISRKDGPFIARQIGHGRKVASCGVMWLLTGSKGSHWLRPPWSGNASGSAPVSILGAADVHIENLAAASYLIEKHGPPGQPKIAAPTVYQNYDLHFAVRSDWPGKLRTKNYLDDTNMYNFGVVNYILWRYEKFLTKQGI